jgi:hypothetical protein
MSVRTLVIVQGQADLLEMIAALNASCRLAGRLHRRQQQANQNANDGNDHQKLDQRERTRRLGASH